MSELMVRAVIIIYGTIALVVVVVLLGIGILIGRAF